MLPTEYREYLERNLNIWERATAFLSGIDERIDYTNILLTRLVNLASRVQIPGGAPTPGGTPTPLSPVNPTDISVGRKLVASVGTAVQLPSVSIPYDFEVVVLALSENTGTIYLGNSKDTAEDHNTAFPLTKGGAVELKIKNLNILWMDSSVSSEGINWIVEQG